MVRGLSRSIIKPLDTNIGASTSNSSLEQQIDGETNMQRSDGIPTISIMPENDDSCSITRTSGIVNESPAVQAPSPVITADDSDPAEHANHQSPSQTCSFKMEKPKMPKFTGDVREYAIFRADFKYAVESKYGKRDAMTFTRTCLQGKPLELIKAFPTLRGDILTPFTETHDIFRTR